MDPTNPITAERVGPGAVPAWYIIAAATLGLAALVWALLLLQGTPSPEPRHDGYWVSLLDPALVRLASAAAFAVTISCLVLAGRRMWHSPAVGLLAGLLVLLDPWALTLSHDAGGAMLVFALLCAALLAYLALRPGWHHLAGTLVAGAAVLDPRIWPVGIPLALMGLLRGHVYAAPRHLLAAAWQGLALPALGALVGYLLGGPAACASWTGQALLSQAGLHHGVVLLPNPVTWFGGLAALLFLAGAAALVVVRQMRIARLPGRIQIRLFDALDVQHARALWLLVILVAAPPHLWVLFLPLGVAAGVATLGQDAPGFGAAVALILLSFAGLVVARGWGAITGSDPAALLDLVPWASTTRC